MFLGLRTDRGPRWPGCGQQQMLWSLYSIEELLIKTVPQNNAGCNMPITRVLFDSFCHLLLFHLQSVSEQLFHTRAKPYVSLHPMGYFGNQPQILQLQESDIEVVQKRGFNSKSPVSSKHQLLCYLWVSYPRWRMGTSASNLKVELLLTPCIYPSIYFCSWLFFLNWVKNFKFFPNAILLLYLSILYLMSLPLSHNYQTLTSSYIMFF